MNREVLRYSMQGLGLWIIAGRSSSRAEAVKTYMNRIYDKLEVERIRRGGAA